MGGETALLLVRRAAIAVTALALVACGPHAPPRVDPADHDQFFLWAGVPPPPTVEHARVLYILGGEIRRGGAPRLVQLRAVPRLASPEVWLVVRAERLDWDERTWAALDTMLARWRAGNPRFVGLQVDFDAATPGLGAYAAFLRGVRARLAPGLRLSVTGLMDWSAHGDPAALETLAGTVDEVVVQTYQGRATIPGYAAYFRHIATLPLRHKVAVVEGGEWTPPPELARDPRFAGTVVFLLRPPRAAAPAKTP